MPSLFPKMSLGHLKIQSLLKARDSTKGDYERNQIHREEGKAFLQLRAETDAEPVGSPGRGEDIVSYALPGV